MNLDKKIKAILIYSLCIICVLLKAVASENEPLDSISQEAGVEYNSGRNFLHGLGVEKSPAMALEHFKKAADLGHIEAPGAIGYFYSTGLVVEKDDSKAVEWFQKGSEKGSSLAKFNLGRFYLDGKGGLSGTEKGLALMEESANLGLPEAHAALAEIYFLGLSNDEHKPDYVKAAPYVQKAAGNGVVAAINMLGVLKQTGLGVEKDPSGAEECFRRAAMKGDFKAQSNLGHFLNPESKKRSRRIEAIAWLSLAAEQGEPLAIYKMNALRAILKPKDLTDASVLAGKFRAQVSAP